MILLFDMLAFFPQHACSWIIARIPVKHVSRKKKKERETIDQLSSDPLHMVDPN